MMTTRTCNLIATLILSASATQAESIGATAERGGVAQAAIDYDIELVGSAGPDSKVDSAALVYSGSALWTSTWDMSWDGQFVYRSMTNGLEIIDVSEPESPKIVSRVYMHGGVYCVEITNRHILCGTDKLGLIVLDASDPERPRPIGSMRTHYPILELASEDRIAAIAGPGTVEVVDLTTPSQLEVIATVSDLSPSCFSSRGLHLGRGYAYLASDDLQVLDISEPDYPQLLMTIPTTHIGVNLDGVGGLLLVAGQSEVVPASISALTVLDASSPGQPKVLAEWEFAGWCYDVAAHGSHAFIATGTSGLIVVVLADPMTVEPVGCVGSSPDARRLLLGDEFLFVANAGPSILLSEPRNDVCGQLPPLDQSKLARGPCAKSRDLTVYSVSEPTAPKLIGCLSHPGYSVGVAVSGNTVFVSAEVSGVTLLDQSNPQQLQHLSMVSTRSRAVDIVHRDDLLFVGEERHGLAIVDISDPTSPTELATFDVEGWVAGIDTCGSYVYLACSSKRLAIINISNPSSPRLAECYREPGSVRDLVVVGRKAFLVDGAGTLSVLDVSAPADPLLSRQMALPGDAIRASHIAAFGDRIAIAAGHNLLILDVETASEPRVISTYDCEEAVSISLRGGMLAVTHGRRGLRILDIGSLPPRQLARYDTPGNAFDVVMADSTIVVADYNSVIRFSLEEVRSGN